MKTSFLASLACAVALLSAGCGHVDLSVTNSSERVLNGVISAADAGEGTELPANTQVIVRVLDLAHGMGKGEELGEQIINGPLTLPVHFRVEYMAEDSVLLGSVNVEARISVGGQLRYITVAGHPVTLGNANQQHVVVVERAEKP